MKKILFICKHNLFRSKVAEAYFKKINKNPNIRAESAGVIKGEGIDASQKRVVVLQRKTARELLGIKINGNPREMSISLLRKIDKIIVAADDIPRKIFNNKNYVKNVVVWKIPDATEEDKIKIKRTILMIKEKIDRLVKELK